MRALPETGDTKMISRVENPRVTEFSVNTHCGADFNLRRASARLSTLAILSHPLA
jgi:hypothetical protein